MQIGRKSGGVSTGSGNTGRGNSGDRNAGNNNSGSGNKGNQNTGSYNAGSYNPGKYNSGDYNTGDYNTGDYNSGDYNSGDYNSGNHNKGKYCSGDWNSGYGSTGCFCTQKAKIRMFDKDTDWTIDDWNTSRAKSIMEKYHPEEWVASSAMTDAEKTANPWHTTTGGFLRKVGIQDWWKKLPDADKAEVKKLPNFSASVFKTCTGITV